MAKDDDGRIIEEYIELVKKDEQISEGLFCKVYAIVQRWFRWKYKMNQEDYLDLINEAFCKFYKVKHHFRGTTAGELYKYFEKILESQVKREKRKMKKIIDYDRSEGIANPLIVSDLDIQVNEEIIALQQCIENLPDTYQKIAYELLVNKRKLDIAKTLSISPSALTNALSKMYKLIHDCLVSKGYTRQLLFN